MAPTKKRNVKLVNTELSVKTAKIDLNCKVDSILGSRKHANDVFDVFEFLQSENEKDVFTAVDACSRLFGTLLERNELFKGKLPAEDDALNGEYSAQDKYRIFMRHRYSNCVEMLLEHLNHELHDVQEASLCCLMKFAAGEGQYPLEDLDWSEHYSFPRNLIQALMDRLMSRTTDKSLLISRFHEFLEKDDVRYYVMSSIRENMGKVMDKSKGEVMPVYQQNVFTLMSNINMARDQSELSDFMVKQEAKHEDWKAAKLIEHKRTFERMWLGFLKYKLPTNMYKKVLVILHDAILPHMSKPTLMIDFLTAAYSVGGAISLLALNGLFVLIHQHNLEYPDFYKKLYNLLEPSIFHVKYRARFFHLANLFLSSSHLPLYLVAAFAKRLARLGLTAPPTALLIVLPFIYNLIRRHPSCRVLIHKPSAEDEPLEDPYIMDEDDPAQCNALESSLWEIKTLQRHYHPDVAKMAMLINTPLPQQEDDISETLEKTTFELMEKDLKQTSTKSIPLEFETATQLLKVGKDVMGQHFCLE
ncbi:nucleolar complex protein 4 homolog [Corythoichthys intestinalis]|uniref:nucleolar complex protein 4 homolog n=1 Tax=Corythoichthys intestinalis TaxID=161448 RepID=UPI0025A53B44|nr:nucleolar complex protein 4 homolog [Corythoichthys intestinalis]XP_061800748.1 nucleolar complex protein 4 homolog [Nerophis lumbriciformis]